MKTFYSALSVVIVGSFLSLSSAWAVPDPVPDPDASVVYLRTSCEIANSDAGESPLEDCFEDMAALKTWAYGRTNPAAKLLIDIGPGSFGAFSCNAGDAAGNEGGQLTFRGAGVDKTVINGFFSGIWHQGCLNTQWAFEDMTIKGIYAVVWIGTTGGKTIWTNVLLDGKNSSWYEQKDRGVGVCSPGQGGTHLFFSSRLIGRGPNQTGFLNRCGDDWFWGSEIALEAAASSTTGTGILSEGEGNRVHLYGSNVRVELDPGSTFASGGLSGISAANGAEVHSHGVGIDVIAKPGWSATALTASNGAHIHASESAYFFGTSTAGIDVYRIYNTGGTVHAPHQWSTGVNPPDIQSIDGSDTAIVTGTSDGHPHMVVYDSSCASSWYDMVDGACRP